MSHEFCFISMIPFNVAWASFRLNDSSQNMTLNAKLFFFSYIKLFQLKSNSPRTCLHDGSRCDQGRKEIGCYED